MIHCALCHLPAERKSGRQYLCAMHLRMRDMRVKAKTNGKEVPTKEFIQELVRKLLDDEMRCPKCRRTMNWMRKQGQSTTVSLQHDRSGSMRIICVRCNTQHYYVKEDLFYEIPKVYRWCPKCDQVLPLSTFSKNTRRLDGAQTLCRKCAYRKKKVWLDRNRARASEYERIRRQKHRDMAKAVKNENL